MAIDYFVIFKDDKPTEEKLQHMLEDYLSGAAINIDYSDKNRWIATLHGKPSFPFRRTEPMLAPRQEMMPEERWFEVYVGHMNEGVEGGYGPNIDVITRMTDEYTNDVARGFAKMVARYYRAELEDGT